ncbi:hypothetical protein SLS60_008686 [Paraconiothyrium brasiliense]|uniref:Bacteriophage T5 Orf172 DNA-binding domain-containing protein n=1 Tax=Paraconiothyrium brasiliense TaxID=300254 RepID=A0ABR3QYY6_9PLEO
MATFRDERSGEELDREESNSGESDNESPSSPFRPVTVKEPGNTFFSQYQTITFQQSYSDYSLEELRCADYAQGRKFGDQIDQAGACGKSNIGTVMEEWELPTLPPLRDDTSLNERCTDLSRFMVYLKGINPRNIVCLLSDDHGNCPYPISRRYQKDFGGKFNKAAKHLYKEVKDVRTDDFIEVVRTYFCGSHDFAKNSGRKAYRIHFKKLWEEASEDLQTKVWDALRKCERGMYIHDPLTPQQDRPGLARTFKSAPKGSFKASEQVTPPGPEPNIGTPTRPWTVQGRLNPFRKPEKPSEPPPILNGASAAISLGSELDLGRTGSRNAAYSPGLFGSNRGTFVVHYSSGTPPEYNNPTSIARLSPFETLESTSFKSQANSRSADSQPTLESLFPPNNRVFAPQMMSKSLPKGHEPSPQEPSNPFEYLNNVTPKSQGESLSNIRTTNAKEPSFWWPNRDRDLQSQTRSWGEIPEMTATPFKGKSIFDVLGSGRTAVIDSHVGTLDVKDITPKLASPSQDSEIFTPRTPTPNGEPQIQRAPNTSQERSEAQERSMPSPSRIGAPASRKSTAGLFEKFEALEEPAAQGLTSEIETQTQIRTVPNQSPVQQSSSPPSLTPGPKSPSKYIEETATQTPIPGADHYIDETPKFPHEKPTTRGAFLSPPPDTINLESLSVELEKIHESSQPSQSPMSQDKSSLGIRSLRPQYNPRRSSSFPLRSSAATANKIKQILKEDIQGVIYVLEAPIFFSGYPPASEGQEVWVKIGWATDLNKRIEDIRSDCGIDDLMLVWHSRSTRTDVLKKIESVCHEQLNNYRRRMDCKLHGGTSKCNTLHKEWFAVDKQVAIRTVKMWRSFLDHNPYGVHGVFENTWRDSVNDDNVYCNFETEHRGTDQAELLHQSLEAWIERTVEGGRKETEGHVAQG